MNDTILTDDRIAAEDLSGPSTREAAADVPGVLRGPVILVLETRQGQRLVRGRSAQAQKPAIIGLLGFASLVRTIWHGARADDPYADAALIRVDEAVRAADAALGSACRAIEIELTGEGGLEASLPASVAPVRISLRFSNPYAFRAAKLLGTYDHLVKGILCARHIGVLDRQGAEVRLRFAGRTVRRALQSATGYRMLGVTRADVVSKTARAMMAREAFGELAEDVLSGATRAPFAPTPAPSSAIPLNETSRPKASESGPCE